ncbi:MAG TPA: class I SAM-dependent methyltransferase [Puia sp.]|nr:class I SAM-dependent methyltransferase [Puia sp.]
MAKDLFSIQADLYAKYRPSYPTALIDYILGFVENKKVAWDCATGNGQGALLYADKFEKVFATDTSEKQIAQASPHSKISYSISAAENTFFADNSFDLITVAQAYHWFQFDSFFTEATRVGKNNCIVAVWGYSLFISEDEKLNCLINYFYVDVVGKYWDAERKHVDEGYKTVSFNFAKLPSKSFSIDVEWNFDDLIGYFNTWSSVQHFIKENGFNPVDEIAKEIKLIWDDGKKKHFSFPIFLLIGKVVK